MRFRTLYLTEASSKFKLPKNLNAESFEYDVTGKVFKIKDLTFSEADIKKGYGVKVMTEIFKWADRKKLDVVILGEFEQKIKELRLSHSVEGVKLISALILAQKPALEPSISPNISMAFPVLSHTGNHR